MKFLLPLLLLFGLVPGVAHASNWSITNYVTDVVVQPDGVLKVSEEITTKFNEPLRGIYRDIPITYKKDTGEKLYSVVDVLSVRANGRAATYTLEKNQANLRIKIGDADTTLSTGPTYSIVYRVKGVGFRQDYPMYAAGGPIDELNWNVIGPNWDVPIAKVSGSIRLPENEENRVQRAGCSVGIYETAEDTRCVISGSDPYTVNYTVSDPVYPREFVTVFASYNGNSIPQPKVGWYEANGGLRGILPYFAASVMVVIGFIILTVQAKRVGIERKNKKAIMPIFTPPANLTPLQMGYLKDGSVDAVDIVATIIDLATKGYLTIEVIESPKLGFIKIGKPDYRFTLLQKLVDVLTDAERLVISSVFISATTANLSDFAETGDQRFLLLNTNLKKLLQADMQNKGYMVGSKMEVGTKVALPSLLIAFGLGFAGIISSSGASIYFIIAAALLAAVSIILGVNARYSSDSGAEMKYQISGYAYFLERTEKYRQPFFESEGSFAQMLPYAMVFGVSSQLAKAFEQMNIQSTQPSWFVGNPALFSSGGWVGSLSGAATDLSTQMSSISTSSGSSGGGGGFSGGGGGGGGGGSW